MENYIKLTTNLFKGIKKNDLQQYFNLPNNNKQKIMAEALAKLQNDSSLIKPFFEHFQDELAVNPYLVEKWLGITRTERKRWTEDGKLKILHMQEYNPKQYDGTYEVCMYDRWFIENLTQNTINEWREEHKNNIKTIRVKSANKAAETRKYIKEHTPKWLNNIIVTFDKPISNKDLNILQLQSLNDDYSNINSYSNILDRTCTIGQATASIDIGVNKIIIDIKNPYYNILDWPYTFLSYKTFKYNFNTLLNKNMDITTFIKNKIISTFASLFGYPFSDNIEGAEYFYRNEQYRNLQFTILKGILLDSPNFEKLFTIYKNIVPVNATLINNILTITYKSGYIFSIDLTDDIKAFENSTDIPWMPNLSKFKITRISSYDLPKFYNNCLYNYEYDLMLNIQNKYRQYINIPISTIRNIYLMNSDECKMLLQNIENE